MITIFTLAFNEEIVLQFMLDHYRARFPKCHIVLRDNESTDNTTKIAKENNCEIIYHTTNGFHDDFDLRNIKNNCWRDASTDWVLVCDPDELLDINEQQLREEEKVGTTIIKTSGYDMVNMEDSYNLNDMIYGLKDFHYDKLCLFNKKYIKDINYECGAHISHPVGHLKFSEQAYTNRHYNWINPDYLVARCALTAHRMSETNRKLGMGAYNFDPADKIRQEFENRRNRIKLEGIKVL